jgi:lipoprotein-releasing system permease protein
MYSMSFLLAWRYLTGARQEKNIAIMIKICCLGILIGTFSLTLITCIMRGFEKITHEQLQGIHANIMVRAYGNNLNLQALAPVLDHEIAALASWSPTTVKQGIIQGPESDDITHVTVVKGIDPAREVTTTSLCSKITQSIIPHASLSTLVHDNHILIGKGLAQELGVTPGAPTTLLFTPDEQTRSNHVTLKEAQLYVSGIFSTGIEEFDNGLIFCSLEHLHTLWPESGVKQINIKLNPGSDENAVKSHLEQRLKLEVYTWKDLYPALVSALKLEKYAMFFILALVTLVASMNIISLTFMQATQKRGDIAILKAMGMSNSALRAIFLMVSTSIALIGTLAGLGLAALAGWLLQTYPFITLPDTYYVSHIPVVMEPSLFVLVFIVVISLSLAASWLPAHRATQTNVANLLRYEA